MAKDQHEKRTVTTIVPETTKLGAEAAPPEKKVASPELAELIEVFGKDRGLDLFQEGVLIDDVRKYKELIEKFGIPAPKEEPATLSVEEPKPDAAAAGEVKKDENTDLKALILNLEKKREAETTALKAEITGLKAAFPRGEKEPLSHGLEGGGKTEEPKKTTSIDRYAAKITGGK